MIRQPFVVAGLLVFSSLPVLAAPGSSHTLRDFSAGELRSAHLTSSEHTAQLTLIISSRALDTSGRTSEKIFTLERPHRVVVDLPAT